MVEHLASYFVDFGEAVVFGTQTATAIVDLPTRLGNDVLSRDVSLTCIETDVSALAAQTACTIRGVSYTVRTVEPDGTGLTMITVTKP